MVDPGLEKTSIWSDQGNIFWGDHFAVQKLSDNNNNIMINNVNRYILINKYINNYLC